MILWLDSDPNDRESRRTGAGLLIAFAVSILVWLGVAVGIVWAVRRVW